jgi:hypothetical protein
VPVSEIRRRLRKLREEFGGGKPEGNRATRYVRDNGVRKAEGEREPEESGGGFF